MKEDIRNKIRLLKELIKEEQLLSHPFGKEILEQSCSFIRGELAQFNRQGKVSKGDMPMSPNSFSTPASNTQKKASEKQIETLYKLNADFNAETITAQEAFKLIGELLDKQKESKKKKKVEEPEEDVYL